MSVDAYASPEALAEARRRQDRELGLHARSRRMVAAAALPMIAAAMSMGGITRDGNNGGEADPSGYEIRRERRGHNKRAPGAIITARQQRAAEKRARKARRSTPTEHPNG